jgi:hypothetical protein
MQWGMFSKMQGTDVLPVLASPYSSPSSSNPIQPCQLSLLSCQQSVATPGASILARLCYSLPGLLLHGFPRGLRPKLPHLTSSQARGC